jgi:hypothetical protein
MKAVSGSVSALVTGRRFYALPLCWDENVSQTQATNKHIVRGAGFICRHPAGNLAGDKCRTKETPAYITGTLQRFATDSTFSFVSLTTSCEEREEKKNN